MGCTHKEVLVCWDVLETGGYDKETHTITDLGNREWGFPARVTCQGCDYEFSEGELQVLNLPN